MTAFYEVRPCGILRRFGMTTRNAVTAGLIWGSLLRASLYGVLLGAAFGGLYGAAGGTLTFPLIGTVVGLFFGALSGAVVVLPLGVLDGVLLSWLAVRYSYHERPNARRYRARAGIACAVGSLLALVADWALHDLPTPTISLPIVPAIWSSTCSCPSPSRAPACRPTPSS
jgi:cytochrome bd-type quinol oxidase subunit 2